MLKTLEESLIKNGLNYKVTMTQDGNNKVKTTVTLFDTVTGNDLGSNTNTDVESAISGLIGNLLGKFDRQVQLSRL